MQIAHRSRRAALGHVLGAVGGVVLLVCALLAARSWGWEPVDEVGYVVIAVLLGATWVGARYAPRTTLAVVALLVASPAWRFPDLWVRIVPLVLAGLLAAVRGVRLGYLAPVYTAGLALALVSDTTSLMWRFRDWGVAVLVLYGDNVRKLLIGAVAVGIVAVGYLVHRQRVGAETLRVRNLEVAALRREEDARMIADTRAAIARDIHDVVAHHMSAVVVTAQSAAADPRRDADALHRTVVMIAAEGREALASMRRAVRMLRTESADPTSDRAPDLGVALEEMAERVRATGRAVVVEGTPTAVPQFAQVAIARIVQEALTNVMLHSDASAVTVSFRSEPDELVLRVADDGSSGADRPPSGGGHGVAGMSERAQALGGTLTAGTGSPGTGWVVAATLPVKGL